MNFEDKLAAKQPLVYANDVSDDYSKSVWCVCVSPSKKCIKTRKCDMKECMNKVELHKTNYNYTSTFMVQTVYSYPTRFRTKSVSFYYFCSDECKKHFEKYCCCYKCEVDCTKEGQGTFIKKLDYTLCNSRGDMETPCMSDMVDYKLEQRFTQEYIRHGYYKIDSDIIDKLLNGCDDLKRIIADNGNTVSYNMLKDMYMLYSKFEFRERENEDLVDEETFYEYYNTIKNELQQH